MKNKKYVVSFRRKREGKTDYRRRLKILVAGTPRLVIRKALKNILLQIVVLGEKGDVVLTSANSKELEKQGWKFGKGNITAAYLTGLLAGKKAKKLKIDHLVLDLGLNMNAKGSRIYAALKGVVDSGIKVPCSVEIFPSDERIKGAHISNYFKKIKQEQDKKSVLQFSVYAKKNLNPDDVSKEFEAVKNKIMREA